MISDDREQDTKGGPLWRAEVRGWSLVGDMDRASSQKVPELGSAAGGWPENDPFPSLQLLGDAFQPQGPRWVDKGLLNFPGGWSRDRLCSNRDLSGCLGSTGAWEVVFLLVFFPVYMYVYLYVLCIINS